MLHTNYGAHFKPSQNLSEDVPDELQMSAGRLRLEQLKTRAKRSLTESLEGILSRVSRLDNVIYIPLREWLFLFKILYHFSQWIWRPLDVYTLWKVFPVAELLQILTGQYVHFMQTENEDMSQNVWQLIVLLQNLWLFKVIDQLCSIQLAPFITAPKHVGWS